MPRHKRRAKVRRRDTSARNRSVGRAQQHGGRRNSGGRDLGDGAVGAPPADGAQPPRRRPASGEAPNPPRRYLRITPPPELQRMAETADRIAGPPGDLARMLAAASQARLGAVEIVPRDDRETLDRAGIGVVAANSDATYTVRWADGSVTPDLTAAELMEHL